RWYMRPTSTHQRAAGHARGGRQTRTIHRRERRERREEKDKEIGAGGARRGATGLLPRPPPQLRTRMPVSAFSALSAFSAVNNPGKAQVTHARPRSGTYAEGVGLPQKCT